MKHLEVLLLPPEEMLVTPLAVCRWYPFIYLDEERQSGIKYGRGLNPGPPEPQFEMLTARPHTPPQSPIFYHMPTFIRYIDVNFTFALVDCVR